ncbi:hypothetical protein ACFC34_00595 [Streptomyces sp. NPDC056053]|uniref:hypothetical protein n=1 Tax=Streptomyces sp. NPDC056053 TaxID=3345696 RepID=UPI0035D96C6A
MAPSEAPAQMVKLDIEGPRTAVCLRERIEAALLAEWLRRVAEQVVASPEEHCVALADVALNALENEEGAA